MSQNLAVQIQNLGGNNSALNVAAAKVIKNTNGTLFRVLVQAVGSGGTLTLNDVATVSGAAAGNQILTLLTASLTVGQVISLEWPCLTGIVVSACSGGIIVSISYS
jgi:mRNA-degrading endonuclease toxin of MazEF toxin-antitoxin module